MEGGGERAEKRQRLQDAGQGRKGFSLKKAGRSR